MKEFMESDHNALRDEVIRNVMNEDNADILCILQDCDVSIYDDLYEAVQELASLSGMDDEGVFIAGLKSYSDCDVYDDYFYVDTESNTISSSNDITSLVDGVDLEQELRERFHTNPMHEIFKCKKDTKVIPLELTDVSVEIIATKNNLASLTTDIYRVLAVLAVRNEDSAFNELARHLCINVSVEWEN